ncbi:UNVERIFIED_CONTAM: hypothetical protein FKN15_003238 [Acipenser sinensis]
MLFLMSVMVLVGSSLQSIKSLSFSPGPGVLKTCARLYHLETGSQLELQSLPEKIPVGAGGSGGLSSFRVMEGCVLTLWGGAHSRSFPSGAYPNITVGGSSAFHCSCEAEGEPLPIRERYEKFVKQHIDNSPEREASDGYSNDESSRTFQRKRTSNSDFKPAFSTAEQRCIHKETGRRVRVQQIHHDVFYVVG